MGNLPHGYEIYLVNIKTMRKIAQIFVAISEKPKFTFIKHTRKNLWIPQKRRKIAKRQMGQMMHTGMRATTDAAGWLLDHH